MGRKAGLTTDLVIDTAATIADREGLENLTLAGLAIELGVRSPSLYNHVSGLEGIRRELALRGVRMMANVSEQARQGLVGEAALRALCHQFRQWALTHPGLYAATVPGASLIGDEEIWAQFDRLLSTLVAVLGEMGVEEEGSLDLIRTVRAALHGYISLELANGFGRSENVDESFGVCVDTLVAGIQHSLA